jgi:hypothetical protein
VVKSHISTNASPIKNPAAAAPRSHTIGSLPQSLKQNQNEIVKKYMFANVCVRQLKTYSTTGNLRFSKG